MTPRERGHVARAGARGLDRLLRAPRAPGDRPSAAAHRRRAVAGPLADCRHIAGPHRHAAPGRARHGRAGGGARRPRARAAAGHRRPPRVERWTGGPRLRPACQPRRTALKSPNDSRVLRVIFPWPNRRAVEAEAAEFGVDPLLLVAIVRQESVFDAQALSPAGARGLEQLLPGTAALTARGLDVTFYPDWITVPDLNLHLGAAHLDELLRRFGGRVDAAVAAYNAGVTPVTRWLARAATTDVDQFVELIPYQETRGYVRSVLRNREVYRALYGVTGN